MNGSVNLLLDNSIYCNDLKPRKKAPCLSEPINPIPSDAFFNLFLNGNSILCNCDSLHFIEWIFSTTVLFDREGNYPCLYTDGSYKTTRQVFEQIEDTIK
jgi:hypothetical protein